MGVEGVELLCGPALDMTGVALGFKDTMMVQLVIGMLDVDEEEVITDQIGTGKRSILMIELVQLKNKEMRNYK